MFENATNSAPNSSPPRPFISVHLRCCNVYQRVYANAAGDAFVGWCLKCAAQVRVPIVAQGGSPSRIFSAF